MDYLIYPLIFMAGLFIGASFMGIVSYRRFKEDDEVPQQ